MLGVILATQIMSENNISIDIKYPIISCKESLLLTKSPRERSNSCSCITPEESYVTSERLPFRGNNVSQASVEVRHA